MFAIMARCKTIIVEGPPLMAGQKSEDNTYHASETNIRTKPSRRVVVRQGWDNAFGDWSKAQTAGSKRSKQKGERYAQVHGTLLSAKGS